MSFTTFEDAIKASKAFNVFLSDFRLGLGHAYMLVSPDDEIVSDFFSLVAMTVFCQTHTACGQCSGCRTVMHGNHSDIQYLNRSHEKIKVDAIKDLVNSVIIRPLGERKLYFVERADLMTAEAQNKLLKTLEEPPKDVSIFLGVANESAMLDTVKSRCRVIYMDIFSRETVFSVLKSFGVDDNNAEIASVCSEGLLGKAKRIALSKEYTDIYNFAVNLLFNLKKSVNIIEFDGADEIQKNVNVFLDALSLVLSDLLALKTKRENALSETIKAQLQPLKKSFSERAIANIIIKINEVRKKLSLNTNLTACVDDLFFCILEEKFKWQP